MGALTMTHPNCQHVREQIMDFMSAFLPTRTAADTVDVRPDGVVEFNRQWKVRGDFDQGLFASLSDRDEVIEFGVLERRPGETINLLHVTVLLDDDGVGRINCISEDASDLNFDAAVGDGRPDCLRATLAHFAQLLRG